MVVLKALREWQSFFVFSIIISSLSFHSVSAQELEPIDPDAAYSAEVYGPTDGDVEDAEIVLEEPMRPVVRTNGPSELNETAIDTQAGDMVRPSFQGSETTYGEDDLIGAAEGVFGKGAEGLAGMIEDILRKQGEPNGYIVGREGGGAFVVGVRYGSGKLYHKVEGNHSIYWTGPSVGFDAGANAGNTFVLVYNLFDTEDLYTRFPATEGQAYLLGGLHASYLRRGDIVLIPIRVGAGLRLGVNAGYMRFSKKQRWLPF